MEISLTVIHCIDLTISLLALIMLFLTIKKTSKNDFVTTMIVMSIALMLNIALFSLVYLIDNLDRQLYNIYFYNYWSAFIRMQNVITILWIATFAWLRVNGISIEKLFSKPRDIAVLVLTKTKETSISIGKLVSELVNLIRGSKNG